MSHTPWPLELKSTWIARALGLSKRHWFEFENHTYTQSPTWRLSDSVAALLFLPYSNMEAKKRYILNFLKSMTKCNFKAVVVALVRTYIIVSGFCLCTIVIPYLSYIVKRTSQTRWQSCSCRARPKWQCTLHRWDKSLETLARTRLPSLSLVRQA